MLQSSGLITGRKVISFIKDIPLVLLKSSPFLISFLNPKGKKITGIYPLKILLGFFFMLQLNLSACAWAW